MNNLSDGLNGGNLCLSKVGLDESSATAAAMRTQAAAVVTIDGVHQTAFAASDNIPFSAGHRTLVGTAANGGQVCLFGVFRTAAGTTVTTQGRIANVNDVNAQNDCVELPPVPLDAAMIGMVRVRTSNAVSFIPGTTDLGAAGITDIYFDTITPPTKPLIGPLAA